jgi:hypothetical protein
MGSPIDKWEGAAAYFTAADSSGTLMFWAAMVVVAIIGVIVHTVTHEEKSVAVLRNGGPK